MNRIGLLICAGVLIACTAFAGFVSPAFAALLHPAAVHIHALGGAGVDATSLAGLLIGMTTLGADKYRNFELGDINDYPCVATDIVYEGAAAGDNGSGYARPLVAADPFVGFCLQQCDNSAGSAGDKNVRLRIHGEIELTVGSAALTDVGKSVYASDDDTFTYTATGNSYIGRVVRYVSATRIVVAFDARRGSLGKNAVTTINYGSATNYLKGTAIPTVASTFSQQEVLNQTLVAAVNDILQKINN